MLLFPSRANRALLYTTSGPCPFDANPFQKLATIGSTPACMEFDEAVCAKNAQNPKAKAETVVNARATIHLLRRSFDVFPGAANASSSPSCPSDRKSVV